MEAINDKSIKNKVSKKNETLNKKSKPNKEFASTEKGRKLKFFNKFVLRKYLTKINITYFFVFLVDIIMVVLMARRNVVNYVSIFD